MLLVVFALPAVEGAGANEVDANLSYKEIVMDTRPIIVTLFSGLVLCISFLDFVSADNPTCNFLKGNNPQACSSANMPAAMECYADDGDAADCLAGCDNIYELDQTDLPNNCVDGNETTYCSNVAEWQFCWAAYECIWDTEYAYCSADYGVLCDFVQVFWIASGPCKVPPPA